MGRSLDSPLCITAISAIQSVLMYSGPAIRGQSSGRTSKVKLASWFPADRVEAIDNPLAKCTVTLLSTAAHVSFQIRKTGRERKKGGDLENHTGNCSAVHSSLY